ncbi:RGCVC family protein [Geodermatophilus sabuli]|uniref:Uncharacterized protein n=1 Tax=Geodermatophilus sabuli TaxID=1564158 RepID=A0A285E6G8_9ACTN|nr:RGCVC family protein [Geodermatophilus sabuli]MBB3082448.1 hypothetical protein [Geodermatophilus sabuli]SNX94682.1 hypothetical protein SAMN06893097_101479 [Geodermatophilus sabuli]
MPTPTTTVARPDQDEHPLESGADAGCAVCPHPIAGHDPIALRYCRATQDTAAQRGCVCRNT